jgi:hypothetical protein
MSYKQWIYFNRNCPLATRIEEHTIPPWKMKSVEAQMRLLFPETYNRSEIAEKIKRPCAEELLHEESVEAQLRVIFNDHGR